MASIVGVDVFAGVTGRFEYADIVDFKKVTRKAARAEIGTAARRTSDWALRT